MKNSTIILAMMVFLGGCFGADYVHPDKDEVDYKADRSECRSICLSDHPVDIEVQYSRANLENTRGFNEVDVNRGPRTRCTDQCLKEKGWQKN